MRGAVSAQGWSGVEWSRVDWTGLDWSGVLKAPSGERLIRGPVALRATCTGLHAG
eukprot:CAMPEP_0195052426 /NCGR_PEP_ID=MMETSP0448-20130528/1764_1 /TAXON_ID=66468 /ORGANISM="Heterocapsa triquestra, Strain CCMP 448" /LENGTH=54 /DNA_ID=CAMNT_0040081569 /DNA_START=132 /DNA_END=293 /DNA_ORIENTATION=+